MPKPYGARDRVKLIDREEVARRLDHVTCIALVREAMIALAEGRTRQLRGIIDLGKGDMFGVMPGAMDGAGFGVSRSIFPNAPRLARIRA